MSPTVICVCFTCLPGESKRGHSISHESNCDLCVFYLSAGRVEEGKLYIA